MPKLKKECTDMLKRFLSVSALLLACIIMTAAAFADYGYTSVSDIPMAADFSVRVDFDGSGQPQVVTDYPFESAGASEMNLVYGNEDNPEIFTLKYTPASGAAAVGSWDSEVFGETRPSEEAYRMIRDGEVSTDGNVYISTSNYGLETDWVLVYSAPENNYTEYAERTYAQAFNAMGNGGTEKAVYYRGGKIESARLLKRIYDADLVVEYSAYGKITYASVIRYGTETRTYDYDPSTGLFGGHPLSELGFDDADLTAEPLAARGLRTETAVARDTPAASTRSGRDPSSVFAGSVIVGVLLGLVLFRKFQRRRNEKKQAAQETAESSPPVQEKENPEPAPAAEEYPEGRSMSSSR